MSALWTGAALFVVSASLCFRVLVITRLRERVYAPEWLTPALLGVMVASGGFTLVAAIQMGK